MGRANRPTRTLAATRVRQGDVVLIRYPSVANSRWMLVDYVNPAAPCVIWSGRWAFGADAGAHTTQQVIDTRYTVKHPLDAQRDAQRLVKPPRITHV